MTDRERYHRHMNYQEVDHPPLHMVGPWADTRERWHREGLPRGVDIHEHLGIKPLRQRNASGHMGPWPPFEQGVIEEDDTFQIGIDGYGRKVRNFKDHTSMPEWLDFPVKSRDDLRRFLDEHYDVSDLDARFSDEWEARVRQYALEDCVLIIDGGCYYWNLRSISGVATASLLFYDAPEEVEEFFERYCTVVLEGMRRVFAICRPDAVGFGEDIAYKNGPLVSPDMFRKLIKPRYARAMDMAHEHGIALTWYDSDGDVRSLIPDHLEVGVNSVAPTEVAAGMLPTELRARFGDELRIYGGIDKRQVAKGPEAIDAEIARNQSLIDDGGYLPSIDHSVSADISWDHYRYYVDAIHRACRIPR